MGVSITGYEVAALLPAHERTEECADLGHVYAFVLDGFELSAAGLVLERCYAVDGQSFRLDASYGMYGLFREELCRAAHGVDPELIWRNHSHWTDEPFYELINFADDQGTIGPAAAAALADDFDTHRNRVLAQLDPTHHNSYEDCRTMFRVAADSGLVKFR